MKINGIKSKIIFTAVLAASLLISGYAFAQTTPVAGGLGNAMLNGASTGLSIRTVFSITSYVVGAALCVLGLIRLKSWSEGQVSFTNGFLRIMGGAFLVNLPDVIRKLENSFFSSNTGWKAGSSLSGGMDRTTGLTANTAQNGGWLGLDQAMENFIIDIYSPAKALCAWAAWILGLMSMIIGVHRLAHASDGHGKAPSAKGTAGYILGGSLMLAAGNLMDAVSTTIFGSNFSTLQFTALATSLPGASSAAVNNVVQAMFAFVEIIGWIAFIRGVFLLVKLAQGGHERSHAHAFSHIVFGAAAVNMYAMVSMLQKTLGVNLVQ